MSRTRVMESRAYDSYFDPIYKSSVNPQHSYAVRYGPTHAWSSSTTAHVNQPAPQYDATTTIKGGYRQTQAPTTTTQSLVPALMPDGTVGAMAAPVNSTTKALPVVQGIDGQLTPQQVLQQLNQEVLGRSRIKFFKRPVVPFLTPSVVESLAPSLEQASALSANYSTLDGSAQSQVEASHKTVGTQSDYRENETQTDPYTPDYITSPHDPEPEILALAHLTYGAGLPATMEEIRIIERMREKRLFEASLPPITDAASFEKRKKLLEERELQEWKMREEEMKQEQEDRLHILIDTLKTREAKVDELNEKRIDRVRQLKMLQRDEVFDAIHRERIQQLRVLGKQRLELDQSTSHMSGGAKEMTSSQSKGNHRTKMRDIVGDYFDFASEVYAPVQHQGKLPVKNQVVDYGIPLISNFAGLNELEKQLAASVFQVQVSKPNHLKITAQKTRKGLHVLAHLDYVDSLIQQKQRLRQQQQQQEQQQQQQQQEQAAALAATGGADASSTVEVGSDGLLKGGSSSSSKKKKLSVIENVYKKFEPVQRAPTPAVLEPSTESADVSILLLQRLLRGRMVQNNMYSGKLHHAALIKELRWRELPVAAQPEQPEEALAAGLELVQGEVLASSLDWLQKEVVRRREENFIAAYITQARLIRRHREAEEAGRRQAESLLTRKRELQLAEVLEQHAWTTDRYLQEVMDASIEQFAHAEALQVNEIRSEVLEPLIAQLEQQHLQASEARHLASGTMSTSLDHSVPMQTMTGDLVHTFLLPEVARRGQARAQELEERRFVREAHQAVVQVVAQATAATPAAQSQSQSQQQQQS